MTLRRFLNAGLIAISLLAGVARAADPVVVASKADTEGAVLGSLIQLALEDAGIPTESRLGLGDTDTVRAALLEGEIDLYPEYTGNGARFFDMIGNPIWMNRAESYAFVREHDLAVNSIVWLEPADADNSWAISVRGDLAREQDLHTLADLARYLNDGGHFKLAASREFVESRSALPAFQWAYGFDLGPDQLEMLPGRDTASTMRAAASGEGGVNAAMAYGTDGGLKALDLRIMTDPQGVQPVYLPSATLRRDVLDDYPQIPAVLKPVFAALNQEVLQQLNEEVAIEAHDAHQVAERFLASLRSP